MKTRVLIHIINGQLADVISNEDIEYILVDDDYLKREDADFDAELAARFVYGDSIARTFKRSNEYGRPDQLSLDEFEQKVYDKLLEIELE